MFDRAFDRTKFDQLDALEGPWMAITKQLTTRSNLRPLLMSAGECVTLEEFFYLTCCFLCPSRISMSVAGFHVRRGFFFDDDEVDSSRKAAQCLVLVGLSGPSWTNVVIRWNFTDHSLRVPQEERSPAAYHPKSHAIGSVS